MVFVLPTCEYGAVNPLYLFGATNGLRGVLLLHGAAPKFPEAPLMTRDAPLTPTLQIGRFAR